MRTLTSLLMASTLTLAASDALRADGTGPVAEVVEFRLVEGADEAAFVEAAIAMEPFLKEAGGMIKRTLSKADDGTWTDHIIWASMDQAQSAAAAIMKRPEAGPFMSMINPEGMEMRHDAVMLEQH